MKHNIIILGLGYLGFNIAEHLASERFKVTAVGLKNVYAEHLSPQIRFVEGNIADESLMTSILSEKCEVIYAAGSIYATETINQLSKDIQTTYLEFLKVLNICNNQGVGRILFLSSAGAIYGNSSEPHAEESPLNPVVIYGLQKLYFEKVLHINSLENKLPYVVLRLSNAYGGFQDRERNQGIIPILIRKTLQGEPFELWASLDNVRDFVYIDDITRVIQKVLSSEIENQIYNIASSKPFTLGKIIGMIEDHLNKRLIIKTKTSAAVNISKTLFNTDKAQRDLDFCAACPLEEGIRREIERITAVDG